MDSTAILFLVLAVGAGLVVGLFERETTTRRTHRPRRRWQNGASYGEFNRDFESEGHPYRAKNKLLTATELEFYQVLRETVGTRATICPMVRLGDIVEVDSVRTKYEQSHDNRINRKHIDFVLCDPTTMRLLAGVELDDRSHQRADRQLRDEFVDAVFAAAGLPLVHITARRQYTHEMVAASLAPYFGQAQQQSRPAMRDPVIPAQPKTAPATQALRCPKCGSVLVIRTARKGKYAGEQFWACPNYPDCRYTIPLGIKASQKQDNRLRE